MQSRLIRFILELERKERDKTLIFVSHADPIQLLMAVFAGIDMNEYEQNIPLNYAQIAELTPGMTLRFKDGGIG